MPLARTCDATSVTECMVSVSNYFAHRAVQRCDAIHVTECMVRVRVRVRIRGSNVLAQCKV
jgi:hypothetical protein